MQYPLYMLKSEDVEHFRTLGAVKCCYLQASGSDRQLSPYLSYPVQSSFHGIVHFWSADGNEIGYANTFGCPIMLFDTPRVWAEEIKAKHQWFDLTPEESLDSEPDCSTD